MREVAETTGEPPKALENEPELPAHLDFYWRAFWSLHSDRPPGFGGVLPIPFSAFDRYASRYRIDDIDVFDRFVSLIQQMDRVYREWAAKRKA